MPQRFSHVSLPTGGPACMVAFCYSQFGPNLRICACDRNLRYQARAARSYEAKSTHLVNGPFCASWGVALPVGRRVELPCGLKIRRGLSAGRGGRVNAFFGWQMMSKSFGAEVAMECEETEAVGCSAWLRVVSVYSRLLPTLAYLYYYSLDVRSS